jgi:type IV pilus assembly protein PilM
MPASKAIWAIDIGQCALKALHAKTVGDEIEIDSYVIIPHEQILSQPDADEPALIRKTLQKFIAAHTVGKDELVISVPGHRSFARFSKLPPVEPKKIPDIVHYEATQQIPFGIDEVVWDYHVFKNEASPDVEVGIFAIKRSIIAQYMSYFQELNLYPSAIQTAPVAVYNACVFEGLVGKEATIIADVGAQNTNFLIAEDHRLWLRNIPLGGNNFTEALQKSFKLDFAKAEELKCTAATSKYARAVFQAMRPIFSDLSSEFQRSNGFYTSINREAKISQLYSMGSAFKLPGLLKFLQQNLNMPVKKLETFSKVKLAGSINEAEFSDNVLTLAVAYGLIVQAVGKASVNTDLMPPEVIREQIWKGKQFWFVGAAACLLVAAGAIWMRGLSDASAVQTDKDQIQQVMSSVEKYTTYKNEYQQNSNLEGMKDPLVEDFQKISSNRLVLPEILQAINGALPVPQKGLVMSSPEEYKQSAKAVERSERDQVVLSKLDLQYVPNLTEEAIKQIEQANQSVTSSLTVNRTQNQGGGMMGGMGMMPGGMGGMGGMPGGMMGPGAGGMGGGMPGGMMGPGAGGMGGMGGGMPGGMGGGMGGGGMMMRRTSEGASEEDGKKAFIVSIKGTTPHTSAPEFLTNHLLKNLRQYNEKWARKNKKSFWIDHVNLVSCQQPLISVADQETMKKSGSELSDPITDESMVNDGAFSIVFVVNLGTPPAEEEKAEGDLSKKSETN